LCLERVQHRAKREIIRNIKKGEEIKKKKSLQRADPRNTAAQSLRAGRRPGSIPRAAAVTGTARNWQADIMGDAK